ncbi:MAG: N-acetylmuramoyl-L-alanine amidase, partial [Gemmatimonadota bacterium]
MRFVHENGTEAVCGPTRWTGIALAGWMLAAPVPALSTQMEPGVAGEAGGLDPGYPTTVWTELPPTIVSETGYRAGFGTGMTPAGETVEIRPGSPFVRIGGRLLQLANLPVLVAGKLRVPDELFRDEAFGQRQASAESTPAPPPVVKGQRSRRPGPWRVIIDPGHGGHDPGTRSPRSGVQEKPIALAVSKLIYEELHAMEGVQPFLTRSTDVFVELDDRPRVAVERDGDLFVSIHVDAQRAGGTSARGFTTYYLGAARTEEGRQAAMRENTVPGADASERPNIDQLEFILAGL